MSIRNLDRFMFSVFDAGELRQTWALGVLPAVEVQVGRANVLAAAVTDRGILVVTSDHVVRKARGGNLYSAPRRKVMTSRDIAGELVLISNGGSMLFTLPGLSEKRKREIEAAVRKGQSARGGKPPRLVG